MKPQVSKSNAILGILVTVFLVLSVSFVIEFAGPSLISLTTSGPSILEIREHENEPMSHFASTRSCSTCHSDAINNDSICKDLCHKVGGIGFPHLANTTYAGVNDSGTINLTHHRDGPGAWALGCLYAGCHEDPAEQDDARFARQLGPSDHALCMVCHTVIKHDGH